MTNTLFLARAERRLNQTVTGRAIGISRDRFLRIEKGYVDPTDEEIRRLAAFFDKPARALFPDYRPARPARKVSA